LIVGSVGCGKTMMLSGVLNELSRQGLSGCLIRLASMMLKIKSGLAISLAAVQDEIQYFSTVQLLVIDEVDIINPTEKDAELLHTIIDNRYNNQLSTVVVSNKLQEQVVESLGQRIVDRLRSGGCQTVSLKMDSQRC
jgi:DNA replication protein DnaC